MDFKQAVANEIMNALNAASAVNAKVLTFASGPICSDEERPNLLKLIAGLNEMMTRHCAVRGIQFSIEAPHKLSISEQPYMLEQFWAAQASDVRVTCDCAHMTYAGFDAAEVLPVGRFADVVLDVSFSETFFRVYILAL